MLRSKRLLDPHKSASSRSAADLLVLVLCLSSIAYLLCGSMLHLTRESQATPLARVFPGEPPVTGTGFAKNAISAATPLPGIRGPVSIYGSWLGTDASVGSIRTAWYRAVPHFQLFLAGYPSHPGNRVMVEVITSNSDVVQLPIHVNEDPGESWIVQPVSLKEIGQPVRFRVVAEDGSTDARGWLALSDPFFKNNPISWNTAKNFCSFSCLRRPRLS